jgi:hypothetical protein
MCLSCQYATLHKVVRDYTKSSTHLESMRLDIFLYFCFKCLKSLNMNNGPPVSHARDFEIMGTDHITLATYNDVG